MKDLTKGKPSKLILAFAIPIFMANILQLTYSIVDTRIVGSYLGENSLAAVGATTTLSNLMIGFLMGMAVSYIFIIIAGLVATFLYDACAAALRALGDTVTPLVSSSLEDCHCIHTCATAWLYRSDSGRADSMVYHGDTAFGEDIHNAGA